MSFSAEIAIDAVLKQVKEALSKRAGSVMEAFHAIDVDNSNQLNTEEFGRILKDFGIILPPRQLGMLVARFDANGDGCVSIPEFSTFMTGATGAFDALKGADAVEDVAGAGSPTQQWRPGMPAGGRQMPVPGQKQMSATDFLFLSRMEADVEERRRTAFLVELRKDPRFRPSMLEPPKPKFQTVSLAGGPIIKSHKHWKTGLEPKRPYQWGPLGGYY